MHKKRTELANEVTDVLQWRALGGSCASVSRLIGVTGQPVRTRDNEDSIKLNMLIYRVYQNDWRVFNLPLRL
jgi:hypothetical protein